MDVVGIALSGLRASGAGLAVQANNVANQLSDGYKAKRVDLVAEASGGEFMYKANLKVLKTADELAQATLDLKA